MVPWHLPSILHGHQSLAHPQGPKFPGAASLGHTSNPGPAVPQHPEVHSLPRAKAVWKKGQGEAREYDHHIPGGPRLWSWGGERHIMTGDPVILSPKIPSCGCLTQPRRRVGPAVASSWPSVSQEGMDGGRQGGTRIHIVRPQSHSLMAGRPGHSQAMMDTQIHLSLTLTGRLPR